MIIWHLLVSSLSEGAGKYCTDSTDPGPDPGVGAEPGDPQDVPSSAHPWARTCWCVPVSWDSLPLLDACWVYLACVHSHLYLSLLWNCFGFSLFNLPLIHARGFQKHIFLQEGSVESVWPQINSNQLLFRIPSVLPQS